jgi:hypothetical protein
MFAPITKVNKGESNTPCPSTLEVTYSSSNTPCPSTLEVTYSSVEKLSKALGDYSHSISGRSIL